MIRNVTKLKECNFSQDDASCSKCRVRAKAKAKAKGIPSAAEKRRDALKHASKTIYKRDVRSQDNGAGMVDAAFGNDELAAAIALETKLSDVIDQNQGLLLVSDGLSDTELDDDANGLCASSVLSVTLCPVGNSAILRKGEVCLLCKYVKAAYCLPKRKRLA